MDQRGKPIGVALWSPRSEISLRLLDSDPDASIDAEWWHRANTLWHTSREFVRHITACNHSSRQLQTHGPDRLDSLHMEYELEASAMLAVKHAAEAYGQSRPSAA